MGDLLLLLRVLRPHLRWMAAGTALGLTVAVAVVALMAVSGDLIATTAVLGMTAAGIWAPVVNRLNAGIRFFAILRTVGRYGERVLSHEATFRILAELRVLFFQRLAPLLPARRRRYRSGDLLERIVGDIDALSAFYVRVLSPLVVALALSCLVALFLVFFDIALAVVSFLLLIAASTVLPIVASRAGLRLGRQQGSLAKGLRVRWLDTLRGLTELILFGAAKRQLELLRSDGVALIALQRRRQRLIGLIGVIGRLLGGVGLILALWFGVDAVVAGEISGQRLAAVVLAVMVAFEIVTPLATAFTELASSREAAANLREIIEAEPVTRPAPERGAEPRGSGIRMEGVSFRFDDDGADVLQGIDLELGPGQQVAMIGPTGAGKSTIGGLLVRFWDPTAGRISLGDVALDELDEPTLRRLVAMVPQRPHLFSATLRENLLLGAPEAGEEELAAVIETAQLDDVIGQLDGGLETWIGEGGVRLSGGQARRVAIARALLRRAPVLLLDEPTEDLDRETGQRLTAALREHARSTGTSLLLITHQLIEPQSYDTIVLMERGCIVEQGPHDALVARAGRYAALLADDLRRGSVESPL